MMIVRLVVLAFATLSLWSPLLASQQERQRSQKMDPTTGARRTRTAETTSFHSASGGQRIIGYTTEAVVPHGTPLTSLLSATADLISDGYSIQPVSDLLPSTLKELDILVLGVILSGRSLTTSQGDQLLDFVMQGGNLVYLGENNNFFHEANLSVGGLFGLTYPSIDPPEVVLDDIRSHPISRGPIDPVSTVSAPINQPTFFGSIESPGPFGKNLVEFPNGFAHGVSIEPGALAPGSGRAIFLSDINPYLEDYALASNQAFWRNIFAYEPVSVHFEFEDDFTTPLVNGQAIAAPAQFGRLLDIGGDGVNNFGACAFDSNPLGSNALGSDPDLLVDRGNVLILQEHSGQSVPGIFNVPDDNRAGGTLIFEFPTPSSPVCLDLIDICPGPPVQDVVVSLFDASGALRTFLVPGGWTDDIAAGSAPGYGTLNLNDTRPQPGVAATATATETTGYDPDQVVRMEVFLGSSGAVDNVVLSGTSSTAVQRSEQRGGSLNGPPR